MVHVALVCGSLHSFAFHYILAWPPRCLVEFSAALLAFLCFVLFASCCYTLLCFSLACRASCASFRCLVCSGGGGGEGGRFFATCACCSVPGCSSVPVCAMLCHCYAMGSCIALRGSFCFGSRCNCLMAALVHIPTLRYSVVLLWALLCLVLLFAEGFMAPTTCDPSPNSSSPCTILLAHLD